MITWFKRQLWSVNSRNSRNNLAGLDGKLWRKDDEDETEVSDAVEGDW